MNSTTFQFLQQLQQYKSVLPLQTFRTLQGLALAGDVNGAHIGLLRILQKRRSAHANAK